MVRSLFSNGRSAKSHTATTQNSPINIIFIHTWCVCARLIFHIYILSHFTCIYLLAFFLVSLFRNSVFAPFTFNFPHLHCKYYNFQRFWSLSCGLTLVLCGVRRASSTQFFSSTTKETFDIEDEYFHTATVCIRSACVRYAPREVEEVYSFLSSQLNYIRELRNM